MTPVMQEFSHNPPTTYGDCHRAAMASLLDLTLSAVPHFMDGLGPEDGEEFKRRETDWLTSIGKCAITIPMAGDLELVLESVASFSTSHDYWLLGGASRSDCGHTVVANAKGIAHDPHPNQVGIVGPMADGFFWITFICGLLTRAD